MMARVALALALTFATIAAPARADDTDLPELVIEQPVDEQLIVEEADAELEYFAPPPTVAELIVSAAERHGLDPVRPLRIAMCESRKGQDPNAYRWDRVHRGIYQFDRITWEEQAPRHGLPASFEFAFVDALNVELALALMARGQWARWSCR